MNNKKYILLLSAFIACTSMGMDTTFKGRSLSAEQWKPSREADQRRGQSNAWPLRSSSKALSNPSSMKVKKKTLNYEWMRSLGPMVDIPFEPLPFEMPAIIPTPTLKEIATKAFIATLRQEVYKDAITQNNKFTETLKGQNELPEGNVYKSIIAHIAALKQNELTEDKVCESIITRIAALNMNKEALDDILTTYIQAPYTTTITDTDEILSYDITEDGNRIALLTSENSPSNSNVRYDSLKIYVRQNSAWHLDKKRGVDRMACQKHPAISWASDHYGHNVLVIVGENDYRVSGPEGALSLFCKYKKKDGKYAWNTVQGIMAIEAIHPASNKLFIAFECPVDKHPLPRFSNLELPDSITSLESINWGRDYRLYLTYTETNGQICVAAFEDRVDSYVEYERYYPQENLKNFYACHKIRQTLRTRSLNGDTMIRRIDDHTIRVERFLSSLKAGAKYIVNAVTKPNTY